MRRHREPALNTPPRTVPVGLLLCAIGQFLVGLGFLLTGILFLFAPASLRDGGFGQDVAFGVRVVALLALGGVAMLLARDAWGLIRLRPSALERMRALALSSIVVFAIRLVRGEATWPIVDWLIILAAVAVAGYLTLPSVRVLFRAPRA